MNARAMLLGAVLAAPLFASPIGAQSERYDDTPRVRLWLQDDRAYNWGEPIRVFFRAEEDVFVSVVAVDATGRIQVLFPRSPRDNSAVMGGTSYYVDARSTNVFSMSGSAGVGFVFAIASPEPLDLTKYAQQGRNSWRMSYASDFRYQSTSPVYAIGSFARDVLFDDQTPYSYDFAYLYVRSARLYSSRFCYADAPLCRDYWNSGYSAYGYGARGYCYTAFSWYTSLFDDCFLYGAYYRPYIPRPPIFLPPSSPPQSGPRRAVVLGGGWRPDTVSITVPPETKPGTTEARTEQQRRLAIRADQAARRPITGEPLIPTDPSADRPSSTFGRAAIRQPTVEPRVPGSYEPRVRRPTLENARSVDRIARPVNTASDYGRSRSDGGEIMRPTSPRWNPSAGGYSTGGGASQPSAPRETYTGTSSGTTIDRSATSRPPSAPTPAPAPVQPASRPDPSPAPMVDRQVKPDKP